MKTIAVTSAILLSAASIDAAEIFKADNNDDLNLTSSWVGGVVPGADDMIVWRPFTTTDSVKLGADFSVYGAVLTNNPDVASLNFGEKNEASVFTLGAGGLYHDNSGKTTTFFTPVALSADQRWENSRGTLVANKSINLGGHALSVKNSIEVKSTIENGTVTQEQGGFKMSNGAAAPTADFVIRKNANLQFNQVPANNGAARARNVTLDGTGHYDGALLYSNGRKENDGYDVVSGKLIVTNGLGSVRVVPNATRPAAIEIGELVNVYGSLTWFRGTELGLSPIEDKKVGAASIKFVTAPMLSGSGAAGTAGVGIIPYAVCATNDDYGFSFATYDATYGVRPLDIDAEYAGTLVSGLSLHENIRLVNGTDGVQVTNALSSGTTEINALMLDTPNNTQGAGGVAVTGPADAVLKVDSGMIYARQMMSAVNAQDALTISGITLDLCGKGGTIISRQTKQENMTSNAPLQLDCVISNDGGKGVTFGAVANRGLIYLQGTSESTYTGPTRVIGGNVRFCKSKNPNNNNKPYAAIPGDLEVYAGGVMNNGDQLKTTASVKVYGGTYLQKGAPSNSGSGASQVFHDLYMSNGSATFGADGTSSGTTVMNDIVLDGGSVRICRGHRLEAEHLVCSGGTVTFARWNGWNSHRCRPDIKQGITIVNLAARPFASAYEPIIIECGAYDSKNEKLIPGGDVYLTGGLVFTGSDSDLPAKILSQVPADTAGGMPEFGKLRLDSMETFEIGDGAADIDIYISATLADDDWDNLAGGLIKTGAGTLMLANGGSHTGGTSVEAGRLIADGALAGDVTVVAGATFRGGDMGESGALAVGGNITFAQGAKLEFDPGAATTVAGDVVFGGVEMVLKDGAEITEDVLVMKARSFSGAVSGKFGKFVTRYRNRGTELWLGKDKGMVIAIR